MDGSCAVVYHKSSQMERKEQTENHRKVHPELSSVEITGCCFSKVWGVLLF